MITTRSPLRISLIGGGSDVSSHYKFFGGEVISLAINKYVYVNVHPKFTGGIRFAYSKLEEVENHTQIEHKIAREVLNLFERKNDIEISTIADVHSQGSGLGSSSAFTAALISAVGALNKKKYDKESLARITCDIEIKKVLAPIGKQDQYATVFGGLNHIYFNPDDSVIVKKINLPSGHISNLENHLILVYTGISRLTEDVIFSQTVEISKQQSELLLELVSLTKSVKDCLMQENYEKLGKIMIKSWELKKKLHHKVSNSTIEEIIKRGLDAGAYGAKILGAGSGGFVLFLVPPEKAKLFAQRLEKKVILPKLDFQGTQILLEES